jgi:hypothetical protein
MLIWGNVEPKKKQTKRETEKQESIIHHRVQQPSRLLITDEEN